MASVEFELERIERLLTERIRPAITPERIAVPMTAWKVPGEPVSVTTARAATYEPFAPRTPWGAAWETWWFRLEADLPAHWRGAVVELEIDPGFQSDWPGGQAEGQLYDADGATLKAVNPRNNAWRLPVDAERLDVWFEASAIPDVMAGASRPTEQGDVLTASKDPIYTFKHADLVLFDQLAWDLYFDVEVLWQLAKELPTDAPRKHVVLRALTRAADLLDWKGVATAAQGARELLAPVLADRAPASTHTLSAIGHAHIDCAWLWPVRETVRKASRTFSNVLDLAAHYPEFRFACSSAIQYEWVERTNPALFEAIKKAVADGTWLPVGGMWVEPDGNLPAGESLVRQLTFGQRYFLEHFGQASTGMWIPDSFGYTAAYPQLAVLAGMDWFLTQKISWNQTNKFPHHTFWWEGLDGTRLFTHFAPVDNYVSTLEGNELAHAVRNFTEHGRSSGSLVPFGFGDGGGGPVRDMMERYQRARDLEGSPKLRIEHPEDFFRRTREEYPDAPVWVGELYLELHRGTFTSQAAGKRGNRRVESLLHTAELIWSNAVRLRGATFPAATFAAWWKRLLLVQFHDILPGSSIAWVHREAHEDLAELAVEIAGSIEAAAALLRGEGTSALNPSPVDRREVVVLDGAPALVEVPALTTAPAAAVEPAHPVLVEPDGRVGNGLVSFVLAPDATFASVREERAGRELLAAGARGNVLRVHPDHPNYWDAWDVDAHYRANCDEVTDVTALVVEESGPLRHVIRVERVFRQSTFTQWITLDADDPSVRVRTRVDWRERERMLKQHWGLGVRAAASQAEIQFGHVERPTHTNTSWQEAAFELYAHRWLRLAEPGFGVALATDATYGYDARRVLDADGEVAVEANLSLLRSPNFPDPRADLGVHEMSAAITAAPSTAEAIALGYRLNQPLVLSAAAATPAPVRVSGGYVETVKPGDDDPGAVVVRLYEGLGAHTPTVLEPTFAADLEIVDLLERPTTPRGPAVIEDGRLTYTLRPFEVLTVKLTPR